MIEVENERATLQKILTSLFEVEVKLPASMQADVMSGGLEHRMVTRPLSNPAWAKRICHPNQPASQAREAEKARPRRKKGPLGDGDTGAGGAESLRAKACDSSLRSDNLSTKFRPFKKIVTVESSPLMNFALIVRPLLVRPFVDFHLTEGRTGKEGGQKKEGQLHHGFHGSPI